MKNKILYAFCMLFFLAGFTTYDTPSASRALIRQVDPSITAQTNMFTLHQIGLLFMAVSLVCTVLAVLNRPNLAYGLMAFLLTWWSLLYIVSWVQTGYWQSIYGIFNYGLNVAILILCSKIVESPKGMQASLATPLPFELIELLKNKKEESS